MRRLLIIGLLALSACAQSATAKPLDPCCPPYAVVPVAPQPAPSPSAVQRLTLATGLTLRGVRSIDVYQVLDLGRVGALVSGDTIVTVWEVRP